MLFNFLNSWCLHFMSHPQPPNMCAHICQTFMQINSNQVQFVLLRRLWTKKQFSKPKYKLLRIQIKPRQICLSFMLLLLQKVILTESFESNMKTNANLQHGGVPERAAPGPEPPRTASPAAPPASAAARRSPGCGGRTRASAQSGSPGHVQAKRRQTKTKKYWPSRRWSLERSRSWTYIQQRTLPLNWLFVVAIYCRC